jgi:hypothetical protein
VATYRAPKHQNNDHRVGGPSAGAVHSRTSYSALPGFVILGACDLVFKHDAFRIVHQKPLIGKVRVCKHLEMVTVADLLAGIYVNPDPFSLASLQLPAPPMMLFPWLGKLAGMAAVQRPHDADPGQHRGAAALRNED